jgi:hypothetical protein
MTLRPNEEEVKKFLLGTVRHVQHIEYFLERMGLGLGQSRDPQRPHDIIGTGNKFSWPVISGLALQYRDSRHGNEIFKEHVLPSIEKHREQYHHQRWNQPCRHANALDMKLGAADAICSLREVDRTYNGGKHSYGEIGDIVREKSQAHTVPWIMDLIPVMREIPQPNLELITSLDNIPNLGVSAETYDIINERLQETLKMLKQEQNYNGK